MPNAVKSLILQNLPITHIQPLPLGAGGRVFVTIALERSGQHAIINWMAHHMRSAIHLNHCAFVRRRWRIMPIPQAGRFVTYCNGTRRDSGRLESASDRLPLDTCLQALGRLPSADNVIYSFEDFSLESWQLKKFIGRVQPTVVLILRDPYNCLASSLRHYGGTKNTLAGLELKKHKLITYLRHALGIENSLAVPVKTIDYGKWFCDENYQAAVLRDLDLDTQPMHLDSIDSVQPFGGGSSFDAPTIDMTSLRQRALERWKLCQDNNDYRQLLDDPVLSKLTMDYFGMPQPF